MSKLYLGIFSLLFLFIFSSCKDEVNPLQTTTTGLLKLNIDKENVPTNVFYVKATLTRQNYNDVTSTININDDSSTNINISNIAVGEWHLKVEAFDSLMSLKYKGEADVTIVEATLTEVNLSLSAVGSGFGNIYIKVAWGTPPHIKSISEYSNDPILKTTWLPWKGNNFYRSVVLFENNKFKMWLAATDSTGSGNTYYGESIDGFSWTFNPVPVIRYGSVSAILKDGDTYMMYFYGKVNESDPAGICLATSSDGLNWTNRKNVYILGVDELSLQALSVIKMNNKFYLYYCYGDYHEISEVASSLDGINFKDKKPLNFSTPLSIDFRNFRVIDDNGRLIAIDELYKYATSIDGVNWSVDEKFGKNISLNWWLVQYIYDPSYVKIGDEIRMYFFGRGSNYELLGLGVYFLKY